MSAEDNSSADPADIGEALVAALGFEPTEGRKRRGGSATVNEDEPSVDDAFIVVPTESSDSRDSDSDADAGDAELKAAAQPAVTVNGSGSGSSSNGEASKNGSAQVDGSTKADETRADGETRPDVVDDDAENDPSGSAAKSRKGKRRRSRGTGGNKSSSRSQGPAKMATKPPSKDRSGSVSGSVSDDDDADDDGSREQIKSAAKPSISGSEGSVVDGSSDDGPESWDMSESASVTSDVDPDGQAPSAEVKAKVDEITADAISSVAEKSQADLELDRAWEESQAAAKAQAEAAVAKSKSRAQSARPDSGQADTATSKPDGSGDSDDSADVESAAAITGDITSDSVLNVDPPPPTASDAIQVVQPPPPGFESNAALGSNVDEVLAETLIEVKVPTAPPAMPTAPAAPEAPTSPEQVPAAPEAEVVSARADAAPTSPRDKILPKNRLEVRDDELAAQAEARAKRQPSGPSTGFDFSVPNILRRKRRVQARKVRRVVRHIDPWSVLTFSVLFHLSVFAALLLASVLVWNAAEAAGTIENLEAFILDLGDFETFEIKGDVVFQAAVAIAGILTLASSVLLVLLTVVFNLISDLVGGIRLTVIEEETVRVRRKRKS